MAARKLARLGPNLRSNIRAIEPKALVWNACWPPLRLLKTDQFCRGGGHVRMFERQTTLLVTRSSLQSKPVGFEYWSIVHQQLQPIPFTKAIENNHHAHVCQCELRTTDPWSFTADQLLLQII